MWSLQRSTRGIQEGRLGLTSTDPFEEFYQIYTSLLPFLIEITPQAMATELWIFLWVSLSRSLAIPVHSLTSNAK